jgi:uncharacterized membrane protein
MIFLLVLAISTAACGTAAGCRHRFSPRQAARVGMAIALAFAGASHLFLETPFIQHLPPWVPLRAEIVLVSGLVEIALGLALLLPPPARRRVGVALALYHVAVFPGNVYVAVSDVDVDGQSGGIYPWVRLPLQLLFIAWAIWSTREANPRPVETTTHPAARAVDVTPSRDSTDARPTGSGLSA